MALQPSPSTIANIPSLERRTYLTTARQSLPLIQQGTGVNVLTVTPKSATVAPGVFTPFAFHLNNGSGTGADASFYVTIGSLNPVTAFQACTIGAEPQPGNDPSNYGIFTNGTSDSIIGSSGTVTIGACTIDLSNSTFTSNGSNATLTLSISFPAGFSGNHPITVSSDNTNFLNMGFVQVSKPSVVYTTTTTLTATPSAITSTQSTTLQASVTSASSTGAGPTPDGSFSFSSGTVNLGTCTIAGGTCSLPVNGSMLQTGTQTITATYTPTVSFTSSSASTNVTVTNLTASTSVALTATPASPAPAGTAITLSATVTSTATSAPVTGSTVKFYDGSVATGTLLGSAALNASGVATITITPAVGDHIFVAQFQGTTALPAKTASQYPFTVAAAGNYETTSLLTYTPTGATYSLTDTVTFYGLSVPGGKVNFNDATAVTKTEGTLVSLTPTTALPTTITTGATNTSTLVSAIGDFNQDGIPDLATTNFGDGTVTVLLGKPTAMPSYKVPAIYPVGKAPYGVVVGDFDQDGIPDLAVSNLASGTVSILLGKANGTFKAQKSYPTGKTALPGTTTPPAAYGLAIADFNKDGILDLVTTNTQEGTISVLLGNGDGSFAAPLTTAVGTDPFLSVVADFNGDGNPDLMVVNSKSNNVSYLTGDGSGNFSAATVTTYATGGTPYAAVVGDFNQDGRPDVAISNLGDPNAPPTTGSVTILLNQAGGGFGTTSYATGIEPTSVVVLDFNGDGKQDLAVANLASNTVGVLTGNGDGTFNPQVSFPSVASPYLLSVGDLNGDGKPDFAVTLFGGANVAIQLGTQTGVYSLTGLTGGAGDQVSATYKPSANDAYKATTSNTVQVSAATPSVTKTPVAKKGVVN
ncbi:FG-GAP-like repeat-containing protein [Granulicella arctica]|uniref:FG-GAP-like repeat-containing protein n=1 Tax=Granulicella arctica TaxID=940613 RepID=UPI0021E04AC2|nr:FG-GAP-like repeat-containing protein [Granulicella arctica]